MSENSHLSAAQKKARRLNRQDFRRMVDLLGSILGVPEKDKQDSVLRFIHALDEVGLSIVPKVPTKGMIFASLEAMRHFEPLNGRRDHIQWGKHVVRYMAMIERHRSTWSPDGTPLSVLESAEQAFKRLSAHMAKIAMDMENTDD